MFYLFPKTVSSQLPTSMFSTKQFEGGWGSKPRDHGIDRFVRREKIAPPPRNGLEMALAPDGRPPRVGMSACPASPRRRGNVLDPRYRGCATPRHKPGGRTLPPRKACLRRAAKTRQHALRGRAKPPCPEAPAPEGAAVLLAQGLPPHGLWSIFPSACTAHPG